MLLGSDLSHLIHSDDICSRYPPLRNKTIRNTGNNQIDPVPLRRLALAQLNQFFFSIPPPPVRS